MKHIIKIVLGITCIGVLLSGCTSPQTVSDKTSNRDAKALAAVDRAMILKIYVQGPEREGMLYFPSETYAPYGWAKLYEANTGVPRPSEYKSPALDDKIVSTVAAIESILQTRGIEITHRRQDATHVLTLETSPVIGVGNPIAYSTSIRVRERLENGFLADVSASVSGELMEAGSKQVVANARDSYGEKRAIQCTDIPSDWYAFTSNDQNEVIKAANWVRCKNADLMLQKMGL